MNEQNSKLKNCRHDTRQMTDFLAGELSDSDRLAMEQRLESCASCRAKFADLEKTWKLTAELLKGAEVGGIKTPEPWRASLAASEEKTEVGDQRSEAVKSKKKAGTVAKFSEVWGKYSLTDKGMKFSVMEIAASIILVFVVLFVFVGYQLSNVKIIKKLGGGDEYDSVDISCEAVEVKKIPQDYEGEAPVPKKGDTSFFQIAGNESFIDKVFDKNTYVSKAAAEPQAKSEVSAAAPSKVRKDLFGEAKVEPEMSVEKEIGVVTLGDHSAKLIVPAPSAPATTAPQLQEMKQELQSLPEDSSYRNENRSSRSYAYGGKAKKMALPAATPKPPEERERRLEPLKKELAEDLSFTKEKLAETEDRYSQETEKVAKLERENEKLKREFADLKGEDDEGEANVAVDKPAPLRKSRMRRDGKEAKLDEAVADDGIAMQEMAEVAEVDEEKTEEAIKVVQDIAIQPAKPKVFGFANMAKQPLRKQAAQVLDQKASEAPAEKALDSDKMFDTAATFSDATKEETSVAEKVEENVNVDALVGIKQSFGRISGMTRMKAVAKKDVGRKKNLDLSAAAPAEKKSELFAEGKVVGYAGTKAQFEITGGEKAKELNSLAAGKEELQAISEGKPEEPPMLSSTPIINSTFKGKVAQEKDNKKQQRSINDKVGTALEKVGSALFPLPALSMARESARKISCTNNLKQIGLSLRMYSNVYDEQFPEKNGVQGLDQLRSNGFLENVQVYTCPSTTTPCAKEGQPLTEETVSYMYVGGLGEADSVDIPLAFDKIENHENYGNILYIDGHVKGYALAQFNKEIAKVADYLKKKPVKLQTKTFKANLKMWDIENAGAMVDFLSKRNIKTAEGNFEINGDSVKFSLPAGEMAKVEKLFFELNETEDRMKESEKTLPFINTKQKPFSTFSIDVDTASYTRVAKEIKQGKRPASDAVRPEEFINYFDYHYRSPENAVFGVDLEAAPCTFRPMNTVLRIGIQGKRLGSELNRPSVFTILIDCSGSMANRNRLELVQESMPLLLSQLRPTDKVSVISCGSDIKQIVPFVSASNKDMIIKSVNRIEPLGVTNLEKGIVYAYQTAALNYAAGGYNRVLIFTDGISNISTASAEEILQQIETARVKGITNTVLSVGGDGDDAFLEGIADKGDGSYVFLEDINSAKDLFVNQFSARFREIARDVKIQVEFNPAFVREYRQVGYQNRQLSKSDFRNDKVDAGEVGAGQSVTALYELKVNRIMPMVETNIYPPPNMTFATVRIRYRRADTMAIEEREYPIRLQEISHNFAATSPGFKLASAVGEFAEHLKFPDAQGIANFNTIREVLRPLISTIYANDKKVVELENLVRLAK